MFMPLPARFAATARPPHQRRHSALAAGCAACLALVFAGCASAPVPKAEMAVSEAALARAVSAGAADSAPTELRLARDKMAAANSALISQDNTRALRLANEAQADAQLAEVRTRALQARRAADAVQEDRRVLREELERRGQEPMAPAAPTNPRN